MMVVYLGLVGAAGGEWRFPRWRSISRRFKALLVPYFLSNECSQTNFVSPLFCLKWLYVLVMIVQLLSTSVHVVNPW